MFPVLHSLQCSQASYTFYLNADDYVMLYINDRLIGQYTWGLPSTYSTQLTVSTGP